MLIGAGQLVKKRRFATVLLPARANVGRCHPQGCPPPLHGVSSFSESGVDARAIDPMFLLSTASVPASRYILNLYLLCIRQAQRQFIAMNPHLNRIAHRRIFYHRNRCSRNQSHIQKMMPQCTFSANCPNGCRFFLLVNPLMSFSASISLHWSNSLYVIRLLHPPDFEAKHREKNTIEIFSQLCFQISLLYFKEFVNRWNL